MEQLTLAFIGEPELIIDYVVSFAVLGFVLYSFYAVYWRIGITPRKAWGYLIRNWKDVIARMLRFGFFHQKNVKDRYAGIMHVMISYGILILFISTSLIFLSHDILKPIIHRGILYGTFYLNFEVWANLGGLMLSAGIVMAFLRRARKRVRLDTVYEDYWILLGLLILAWEGFFLGALKIYLLPASFDQFRFIEYPLSQVFATYTLSYSNGVLFYRAFWLVHVMTAFAIVAYLPYSKLSHMVLSLVNIGASEPKVRGEMPTPFVLSEALATGNFDFKVGAKTIGDYSLRMRLSATACTDCGRCERACPAFLSGTDLSPRAVVQNIKKNIYNNGSLLSEVVLSNNAALSCTTCQACVEECPVLIDPHSFVLEFRKTMILENQATKQQVQYFNNLANTQNPFGNSPEDRDKLLDLAPKYSKGKKILYWVGCMGAFDPRDNRTVRTILDLLNRAGVDYGILGSEERCNGETARRMGEEGRYQELVMQNVETLNSYGVETMVTACPHCYNTFKNEYPKFGLKVNVIHHSEFLSTLIKNGSLKVKNSSVDVTLHDPCYLGRINGKFQDTRDILTATSRLREMERSREKSMCCGAGGGNYWYKVENQVNISQLRLKQAMDTGAPRVAVACPFCMPMLEDAARTMNVESKIEVRDIAEIIRENLA
ncbi:4Fe-4S dicluster domain-containing protein [Thermoplasmatales archaeon AK]|nr:4Fe-4S dicluster domain-containing protein [Thermoplasmatales archaeon AK]